METNSKEKLTPSAEIKSAEEGWVASWEKANGEIKNGVNPHAYRLGWLDCKSNQLKPSVSLPMHEDVKKMDKLLTVLKDARFPLTEIEKELLKIVENYIAAKLTSTPEVKTYSEEDIEKLLLDVWCMGMNANEVGMPSFDMAKTGGRLKEIIQSFTK